MLRQGILVEYFMNRRCQTPFELKVETFSSSSFQCNGGLPEEGSAQKRVQENRLEILMRQKLVMVMYTDGGMGK